MGKTWRTQAVLAAGLWLSATVADADDSHAELNQSVITASCGGCHHPDPEFVTAIPRLHTLTAEQITAKLLAFREGREYGTVMNRIARGYTPAELVELGEALGKAP